MNLSWITLVPPLLLLVASLPAFAADAPIPLWPGLAPGEAAGAAPEKVAPSPPNQKIVLLTDVTQPTITVYPAPAGKGTGAAVVVCPGGGYSVLAWDLEGTEVCDWLNSIGVSGVLLKYRVPPRGGRERHAAPLQDAQRALGLVRQRATEWHLDPQRVGILGFSAGGHLSATLSNQYEKRSYDPVDAADALSCRPDFTILVYPAYLTPDKRPDHLVPELPVTQDTPPTFLAQTEDDPIRVGNSLVYYLALTAAKVPAEMHLYPSGGHGYGLRPSANRVTTEWPKLAEAWLRDRGVLTVKR